MSQAELGEKIGCTASHISRIENGLEPSYWTAQMLRDTLEQEFPEWTMTPVKRPVR